MKETSPNLKIISHVKIIKTFLGPKDIARTIEKKDVRNLAII